MQLGQRIFDLSRLIEDDYVQATHPKIVGLVQRLTAIMSAKEDVRVAKVLCERIKKLDGDIQYKMSQGEPYDEELSMIARDHMISALIHYTRGTSTSSNSRKHPFSSHWLSGEAKVEHELIKSVRNDAVAHYGFGSDELWQKWHKERLLFIVDDSSGQLSSMQFKYERNFTNYSAQIAEAIERNTAVIIEKLETEVLKTRDGLNDYLIKHEDLDPIIGRLRAEPWNMEGRITPRP